VTTAAITAAVVAVTIANSATQKVAHAARDGDGRPAGELDGSEVLEPVLDGTLLLRAHTYRLAPQLHRCLLSTDAHGVPGAEQPLEVLDAGLEGL
jgi:hypothetical protein